MAPTPYGGQMHMAVYADVVAAGGPTLPGGLLLATLRPGRTQGIGACMHASVGPHARCPGSKLLGVNGLHCDRF